MEEDNEALDWGHDGDDRQGALQNAHLDQNGGDFSDGDDVEDTVSLGEEEDEPSYYTHHQATAATGAYNSGLHAEVLERTSSSQRQDSLGANDQRDYRHNSMEVDPIERSSSRNYRSYTNSPPRQHYSARQSSPPRSQQNGIRMTHALPPKPTAASMLYLPPSHPSMVEAVGMASTSISPPNKTSMRDSKKVNGTPGKPDSTSTPTDLPPHWEKRFSRSGGQPYYHNRETDETTWDLPVSNLPSTSAYGGSQKRRRRSVSPGNMHIIPPPDSNAHNSQTSRPKRASSLLRHEDNLEVAPRSVTPDPRGLSYEDRHYRPGGDPAPASNDMQQPDRNDGMANRNEPKSRYERSPGMSPPRRRGRSISPIPDSRRSRTLAKDSDRYPSRANARSARDRNVYTNQDPPISRSLDTTPVEPDYSDRRWVPSPHLPSSDFSRNDRDRASRRPPHREEDNFFSESRSDNRNRQDLRRRDSSRGPRDREQPRPSERREKPNENPSYLSAPRYRSPPRNRDRDTERDYVPPEPAAHPASASESRRERERERPPRFDYPNSTGPPLPARPPPPPRDPYNGRPRHPEQPPAQQFEQPRYREDRDFDRNRRDPLPGNGNRPQDDRHPEDSNRMPAERPRRVESGYNQIPPEESSLRNKRDPLPPQTKTFYHSVVPGHHRDPVPYAPGWANHDPTLPKEPRYAPNNDLYKYQEPKVPRTQAELLQMQSNQSAPSIKPPPIDTRMEVDLHKPQSASERISPYDRSRHPDPPRDVSEPSRGRPERPPPPRQAPSDFGRPAPSSNTASSAVDRPMAGPPPRASQGDRPKQESYNDGRKESRPPSMYPERNPPAQPRREAWGRSDDKPTRPPPTGPVSGTNNVPIGVRRPPANVLPPNPNNAPAAPPPVPMPPPFNPSARPPQSTLINPPKAQEPALQKGSYDRPPHLPDSNGPSRSGSDTNLERPREFRLPPTVAASRKSLAVSASPERSKRRESRFSQIEPKPDPPRLPQDDWRGRVNSSESSSGTPGNDSVKQSMPPPPSKPTSTTSRFSDRVSISNDDGNRSATSQIPLAPSNTSNESYSHNAPARKDITPPLPSTQIQSSEPSSKSNQQRGVNKPSADSHQSSNLPPQLSQPESPPNLARRMSSEKPPRLRKYPSASPIISVPENEFWGGNPAAVDQSASLNTVSEDLKDRLERPTLLARLQAPVPEPESQPSLRDRLVPAKRDRDELLVEEGRSRGDSSYETAEDGNDNKRPRRRPGKGRRGGGGGGRRNPS